MLKKFLVISAVMLLASTAYAGSVAVNLGTGYDGSMAAGTSAGVVPVTNWNNTDGANLTALTDGTGAVTTTNFTFTQNGGSNAPNVETAGVLATGDGQMMRSGLGTWIGKARANNLAYAATNGLRTATYELTNLMATTGGKSYDVYIYVSGGNAYPNPVTFGSTWEVMSNPGHVWVGPSGLSSRVYDVNNVNANNEAGYLGSGDYHFLGWPTVNFDGTYTQIPGGLMGAGCADDSMALPWNWNDPGAIAAGGAGSVWYTTNWQYPSVRGIPVGNYIKISGLTLDTLDLAYRNVEGTRYSPGVGGLAGTTYNSNDTGGIAGIQIVWSDAPPVAEPAGLGLIGLALLGLRKRRS